MSILINIGGCAIIGIAVAILLPEQPRSAIVTLLLVMGIQLIAWAYTRRKP